MTNNTIHNVPRELLERASNLAFQTQHYPLHEELRALLSAPSPAGVDGLAVSSSGWFSLVMNAAAELETASYSITDPDAKRVAQSGADYYRSKAKSAQVVCLSDAQAIIDGLRGEVGAQRVKTCAALKARNDAHEERDQQAQRIGELEAALEFACKSLAQVTSSDGSGHADIAVSVLRMAGIKEYNALQSVEAYKAGAKWRIDAALSAGKEGSDG